MLREAYLVGAHAPDPVAAEFPALMLYAVAQSPPQVLQLDIGPLVAAGARGWSLDRSLDQATSVAVAAGRPADAIAILTRLQRLMDRRNRASSTAAFDALLERHRALHDLSRPLVRADHEHARDVWQWLLRLDGEASLALQVAALFHDVERLISGAEERVEADARDYQAFKDAHAESSAALLARTVGDLLPAAIVARAARLIVEHERPRRNGDLDAGLTAERTLLADADALSFFSLNSGGYLDYFGPRQTTRKVAWTLGRLSERGRARLGAVELRSDVRAMLVRSIFDEEELA
ncbi:MAG: hypothetical protein JWN44_4696 [Myxococcales bacterium]|nr:hypothetical protein [Myxococcales bacterium]